eukprot:927677-Pelagomonas_calceolata.AAC.2
MAGTAMVALENSNKIRHPHGEACMHPGCIPTFDVRGVAEDGRYAADDGRELLQGQRGGKGSAIETGLARVKHAGNSDLGWRRHSLCAQPCNV